MTRLLELPILPTPHFLWEISEPNSFWKNFKNFTLYSDGKFCDDIQVKS